MFRKLIVPALLAATCAAPLLPAQAETPVIEDDAATGQQILQKLHDELTAKGLRDVQVIPSSFIVRGTDKDGQPVMLLIGPTSTTILTPDQMRDQAPQQAQQKDPSLKNWE
jgi:hypothetical protein